MHSKIKICGIKNEEEARNIADLKLDYIGVIFAKSTRQVNLETAKNIAMIAHENSIKIVGVFSEFSDEKISHFMNYANLDIAQIYGTISKNLYSNLNLYNKQIWKVFSVLDTLPNLGKSNYDMALFDYKGENLGGNGKSFDWKILKNLKPFSYVLAGGIGLENIDLALSLKPAVLDINSKVENEFGIKDRNLIIEILKKAKNE